MTYYCMYVNVIATTNYNIPQANEGECTAAKPGFFDFTGRAKWCVHTRVKISKFFFIFCWCREAWHSLGKMAKEEAVRQYLATVSAISPDWETISPVSSFHLSPSH